AVCIIISGPVWTKGWPEWWNWWLEMPIWPSQMGM
ncbi:MAG: photosynthetic reaction center subunit L, partial [Paracoccaceae bacterium]